MFNNKPVTARDLNLTELKEHVNMLVNFMKYVSTASIMEKKLVNVDYVLEEMVQELDDKDDGSQYLTNFKVFWEYNECLKECVKPGRGDLLLDANLKGYPIYANSKPFWKEYIKRWDLYTLPTDFVANVLIEVLNSLKPEPNGFHAGACYVRENRFHQLETFDSASEFNKAILDELATTLKSILNFLDRISYTQQDARPRTIQFLSSLKKQSQKAGYW